MSPNRALESSTGDKLLPATQEMDERGSAKQKRVNNFILADLDKQKHFSPSMEHFPKPHDLLVGKASNKAQDFSPVAGTIERSGHQKTSEAKQSAMRAANAVGHQINLFCDATAKSVVTDPYNGSIGLINHLAGTKIQKIEVPHEDQLANSPAATAGKYVGEVVGGLIVSAATAGAADLVGLGAAGSLAANMAVGAVMQGITAPTDDGQGKSFWGQRGMNATFGLIGAGLGNFTEDTGKVAAALVPNSLEKLSTPLEQGVPIVTGQLVAKKLEETKNQISKAIGIA